MSIYIVADTRVLISNKCASTVYVCNNPCTVLGKNAPNGYTEIHQSILNSYKTLVYFSLDPLIPLNNKCAVKKTLFFKKSRKPQDVTV